jgi:hypothetical protein
MKTIDQQDFAAIVAEPSAVVRKFKLMKRFGYLLPENAKASSATSIATAIQAKLGCLNVEDGSLDQFVLEYCAAHGIECDGDVFGLYFAGVTDISGAEAEEIIRKAAADYQLTA